MERNGATQTESWKGVDRSYSAGSGLMRAVRKEKDNATDAAKGKTASADYEKEQQVYKENDSEKE